MKILTFLTCAILIAQTAYAATKCVPLNSSTTCTTDSSAAALNKSDWSTTCTTNGKTVTVKGVAAVFPFSSSSMKFNTRYDSLTAVSSGSGMCACKMISPAISGWVFAQTNDWLIPNEAGFCANICISAFDSSSYRSALFSNLSD